MTRSVVTGAAGFVGSHLAEKLLELGHVVIGIDNSSTGKAENMEAFVNDPGFIFYEADIRDRDSMEQILDTHSPIECFFHLAAVVSVPFSVQHPEITHETNYKSTIRLLSRSRKAGAGAFVHAGSAAEYGNESRLPIKEEYASDETEHLSPYGRTKYLASREVARSSNPCGVSLRCFNIYGPRQDPTSQYSGVISRFIEQALKGIPLTVFGDGEQTRDFIFVEDVIHAYLLSAGINPANGKKSPPKRGIYNVGRSESITINRLADIIKSIIDPELPVAHLEPRPGDIRHSLADISKTVRTFGWKPSWDMKEGLKKTIEWYRENPETL